MVLVIPPPATVIVPALLLVSAFAVTLSVSVPLFVPLVGEIESQDGALLVADHKVFDVTATTVVSAVADGDQDVGDTASDTAAEDSCVTVMTLFIPPLVTVTVPVLADVLTFAKVASMNFVLPVPLVGDANSQDSLLDAVQDMSAVINTSTNPTDGGAVHEVIDNSSFPITICIASCVTVMVFVISPAATVIVPVLAVV